MYTVCVIMIFVDVDHSDDDGLFPINLQSASHSEKWTTTPLYRFFRDGVSIT